jgi:NADPH2:quinone reductase
LQAIAGNVFQALRDGALRADIGRRYPLAAAAQAHQDLESRKTSGQLVLLA